MATNRLEKPLLYVETVKERLASDARKEFVPKSVVDAAIAASPTDGIKEPFDWFLAQGYPPGSVVESLKDGVYTISIPAVAYRAPVFSWKNDKGWNSNADSIDILYGDGYYEWSGYSAAGNIVAGIAPIATDGASKSIKDATHSFKIKKDSKSKSGVRYLHKGRNSPKAPRPRTKSIDMPRYRIIRKSSSVYFLMLDSVGKVLETYRSKVKSSGAVMLDISMYASGDYIDAPVFVTPESDAVLWGIATIDLNGMYTESDPDPSLPAMQCIASDYSAAVSSVSFPAITLLITLSDYTGVITSMPAMHGIGSDHNYSDIIGSIPSMSADALIGEDFTVPDDGMEMYGYINMIAGGYVSTVTQLSFDLTAAKVSALASDYAYTDSHAIMPAMRVVMYEDFATPGYYWTGENAGFADYFLYEGTFDVAVNFGLGSALSVTVSTVMQQQWNIALGIHDDASLLAVLQAIVSEGLQIGDVFTIPQTLDMQYAFNADSGALTTYRAFGFNSFAVVGDVTYAARGDGLYRLRAGDDNGEPRNYFVDFGETDFGTAQAKNIDSIYFGLSVDGTEVYAKINDDAGNVYTYQVTQTQPTARALCGKGLLSRRYGLKLEAIDADSFYLDNVEFSLAVSTRRRIP